jgi:hypothetical protein
MNYEMIKLSKRLISCKHFKWMPGMRTLGDWRVINVDSDGVEVVTDLSEVALFHSGDLPHIPSSLPDLNDPATIGCLINLVRIAWNGRVAISMGNGWWSVEADSDNDGFYSDQDCSSSFKESLVLAFEAANE